MRGQGRSLRSSIQTPRDTHETRTTHPNDHMMMHCTVDFSLRITCDRRRLLIDQSVGIR